MVRFPPHDLNDSTGWAQALLSDLASELDFASELLEAVWDVQAGRLADWSVGYNAYSVELLPTGATIRLLDDAALIPLDVLGQMVGNHLGM